VLGEPTNPRYKIPFIDMQSVKYVPLYKLEDSYEFPFEEKKIDLIFKGYHSTRKMKFRPGYYSSPIDTSTHLYSTFAVKELPYLASHDKSTKEKVLRWLRVIATKNHQHILRLLATWHQNLSWGFLFIWAREGNLCEYWNRNSQLPGALDSRYRQIRWIADQCSGIADVLAYIHLAGDVYDNHGDIKPENMLFFFFRGTDQRHHGRLVLCNVGFAYFRSTWSGEDLTAW